MSLGLAFLPPIACGEAEAPTMEDLVGTYQATTFTTEEGGSTTDQLAAGASIALILNADASTAGRLFVPGGNPDGSDFDADLTGTWALNGGTVTLDHAADTFMRDMPYTAEGTRLTGEATFGGVTIRVVFARLLGRPLTSSLISSLNCNTERHRA
jgi:hypothetical protein